MTKIIWYNFDLSMKKGENKKYKKHLKYIQDNYSPEFLSISQMNWADMMRVKPIPVIEFKAPCIDGFDILDDFIGKFSNDLRTSSGQPFKWLVKPKVTKKTENKIKILHKNWMMNKG